MDKEPNQNKIEKKIKLFIVLFVLAMICTLGFSIFSLINSFQNSNNEETTNKFSEKNKKNEVTYEEGNNGEFPKSKSIELYNAEIVKAQRGQFEEIVNEIGKVREKYDLTTDYNKDLIHVYQDANVLYNIRKTEEVSAEDTLYQGINDMKMKVIGFPFLSNQAKSYVTIRNDSICPIAEKSIEFQDYEMIKFSDKTKDEMIQKMQESLKTEGYYLNRVQDEIDKNIYVCYLKIDDIPVNFYLIKRLDNTWTVYAITYRNKETFNQNWHNMKHYYSKSDVKENELVLPE